MFLIPFLIILPLFLVIPSFPTASILEAEAKLFWTQIPIEDLSFHRLCP